MSPVTANTASTRDQILDAAVEVIGKHGLAKATTRRIAATVKCSEATLYRHFPDKQALFLAALDERLPDLDLIARQADGTSDGDLAGALASYALALLDFLDEIVPITAALFADPPLLSRYSETLLRSKTGMHAAHGNVVGIVKSAQASGLADADTDASSVAALLIGACHGYAFTRFMMRAHVAGPAPKRFVDEIISVLLRGLAPKAVAGNE